MKRPLDCWQYPRMSPRMLARTKGTVANRGETGEKAGSEVPTLVLKPGSPVGPFALPGLS